MLLGPFEVRGSRRVARPRGSDLSSHFREAAAKGTDDTMGMVITNGKDVVSYLKSQHQQVKKMLSDVLDASGEQRANAFYALRRMLAIHETAEEEIVHPAARHNIPNGERIVAARLKEENAAKKALTELEALDVDSEEFETKFKKLQKAVLAHAESEEKQEFEVLGSKLEAAELAHMRRAVEIAEGMAPTRPHPGVGESAAANIISGPFMSMMDRARDALSGKKEPESEQSN
jgi:hemerythrin superfamily protein